MNTVARKQALLKYSQSEKFKLSQERYRFSDKGRATRRRVVEGWYAANPEAKRAHNLMNKAMARGKVVKMPCEVCGASRVYAHHKDYLKPLDVAWLCQTHHKEKHKGGY